MNEHSPKVVLAVAAHADDNEFCFGGSIATWVEQGAEVHYLVITDGRRGTASADDNTEELVAARQAEQKAAASVLGVKSVNCLTYEDGRMETSWDLKKDIVKAIRTIKPDTVMCMDPTYMYSTHLNYTNHNDHRVVGQATFDAVYPLARDETAFDDLQDLTPHKVTTLLMHNPNNENFFVDITEKIDQKVEALMQHKSQFSDANKVESFVKYFGAETAKKLGGCEYAEGFVKLSLS